MDRTKLILGFILLILMTGSVLAIPFTPGGDMDLKKIFGITNATTINATQNITTEAWVRGLFDWTVTDSYSEFDGENFTTNETKLNNTIDAKLVDVDTRWILDKTWIYNNSGNASLNLTSADARYALDSQQSADNTTQAGYIDGLITDNTSLQIDVDGLQTNVTGLLADNSTIRGYIDSNVDNLLQLNVSNSSTNTRIDGLNTTLVSDYVLLTNYYYLYLEDNYTDWDSASDNVIANQSIWLTQTTELPCGNITGASSDLCTITDTIITTLPYANITGTPSIPTDLPCGNITGATSDLCTVEDTIVTTLPYENITNQPAYDTQDQPVNTTSDVLFNSVNASINASWIDNAPWSTGAGTSSLPYSNITNRPAYDYQDQPVNTTDAVTFASINTGQGSQEVYGQNTSAIVVQGNNLGVDMSLWEGLFIAQSDEGNLNVNGSNYWDDYDTAGDISTGDLNNDNTYVQVAGDKMTGILDMGSNAIANITTLNTGQGDYELYAMNQDVETTDAVTFVTMDTGQGANELYDMDQNVQTTNNVTFNEVVVNENLNMSLDKLVYLGPLGRITNFDDWGGGVSIGYNTYHDGIATVILNANYGGSGIILDNSSINFGVIDADYASTMIINDDDNITIYGNVSVNKGGIDMEGDLNLGTSQNVTMGAGGDITSNSTCVIIEGATSTFNIC